MNASKHRAPCPSGFVSIYGSSECEACGRGPTPMRRTSCKMCVPGKYSAATKQTSAGLVRLSSGTYSTAPGLSSKDLCTLCPPGKAHTRRAPGAFNSSFCVSCPRDTYQDKPGRTACKPCSTTATSNGGATICTECAAGTYMNASKHCVICPSGFTSTYGASQCEPCGPGTHANAPGTACLLCGEGKYSSASRQTSPDTCTACPAGTYSGSEGLASVHLCTPCPPGRSHVDKTPGATAADTCEPCDVGMFQNISGATQCVACPVGFSNRRRESTACEMCAAGRFEIRARTARGWFRPVDSTTASACEVRPAGFFQGGRGTTFCFECEAGTQPRTGQPRVPVVRCGSLLSIQARIPRVRLPRMSSGRNRAQSCADGVRSAGHTCAEHGPSRRGSRAEPRSPDHAHPLDCSRRRKRSLESFLPNSNVHESRLSRAPRTWEHPPGNELAADLRMNISLANQVYFTRVRAFDAETRTGGQWSTPTAAWTTAEDCGLAEFLATGGTDPGTWGCRACPLGARCSATSTDRNLVPRRGYWRVPWASDSNTFGKCPYADACVGAGHAGFSAGGPEECLAGTKDVLCAVCSDGYNREAGECRECTSGALAIRIGVIGGVFVVVAAVIYIFRRRIRRLLRKYHSLWQDLLRIITINIAYMQISGSLPFILQIPWPQAYLEFLERINFVNVDVMKLLGTSCVTRVDYRVRFAATSALPLIAVLWGLGRYMWKRRSLASRQSDGGDILRVAAETLFDIVDRDRSGTIETPEMAQLLRKMRQTRDGARELMLRLGATRKPDSAALQLSKERVVQGAAGGRLLTDPKWTLWALRQRVVSEALGARRKFFCSCTPPWRSRCSTTFPATILVEPGGCSSRATTP